MSINHSFYFVSVAIQIPHPPCLLLAESCVVGSKQIWLSFQRLHRQLREPLSYSCRQATRQGVEVSDCDGNIRTARESGQGCPRDRLYGCRSPLHLPTSNPREPRCRIIHVGHLQIHSPLLFQKPSSAGQKPARDIDVGVGSLLGGGFVFDVGAK